MVNCTTFIFVLNNYTGAYHTVHRVFKKSRFTPIPAKRASRKPQRDRKFGRREKIAQNPAFPNPYNFCTMNEKPVSDKIFQTLFNTYFNKTIFSENLIKF